MLSPTPCALAFALCSTMPTLKLQVLIPQEADNGAAAGNTNKGEMDDIRAASGDVIK